MVMLVVAAVMMGELLAGEASGMTRTRFQNAEERVLGTIGVFARDRSLPATEPSSRIALEAGEIQLYGIPDLRLDGLRFTFEGARMGLALSGAFLSAPIGVLKSAGVTAFFELPGDILLAGTLDGSVVDVARMEQVSIATVTGYMLAALSRSVSLGWSIENLRVYGHPVPGADMSVCFAAKPARFFSALSSCHLDRWGTVSVGFGASVYLGWLCSGSLGYDDATEQVKAAVSIGGSSLNCDVCVLFHPVLGVSKGVFVKWRR
ncbi:MAG: hypothetical protein GTN64_04360 [Candidatus Latescibacteria bacterium]|nr:hypothetical protein [Candidatus Latescibacterota bacterium]NIO77844.1 hypothetical protein [Candidatus Latescibacterota bacterium]NIT38057.1 hypothetical protein [Candidatus Latescibacterota bacterium]